MSTATNLAAIGHNASCPQTCPHWDRLINEAEDRRDPAWWPR